MSEHKPEANFNDDDELSVEELEDAAGGSESDVIGVEPNENGCHGGNCNCTS